jgi:hypothetical protein
MCNMGKPNALKGKKDVCWLRLAGLKLRCSVSCGEQHISVINHKGVLAIGKTRRIWVGSTGEWRRQHSGIGLSKAEQCCPATAAAAVAAVVAVAAKESAYKVVAAAAGLHAYLLKALRKDKVRDLGLVFRVLLPVS